MTEGSKSSSLLVVRRDDPRSAHILKIGSDALPQPDSGRTELALAAANRAVGTRPRAVWLAPGEYLLWNAEPADLSALDFAAPWHVADLTHGLVSFAVEGDHARALLAKGCTLDFHADKFGEDDCARTRFAQVRALIERTGASGFRLTVEVGYATYLQAWFDDAVVEFKRLVEWP